MSRPLMQHGVGQLGTMFLEGKKDRTVLKALEHELQHRQVPRAVALLEEVRTALQSGTTVPDHRPVLPLPIEPIPDTTGRNSGAGTTLPLFVGMAPSPIDERKAGHAAGKQPAVKASRPQLPAMSLDEACKVLKTTPTASWESIERSRRLLVQQSHPSFLKSMVDAKRAQAVETAIRANAAYARILVDRAARP